MGDPDIDKLTEAIEQPELVGVAASREEQFFPDLEESP
jgi:hypothetical protein